jgi:hypothetical protein
MYSLEAPRNINSPDSVSREPSLFRRPQWYSEAVLSPWCISTSGVGAIPGAQGRLGAPLNVRNKQFIREKVGVMERREKVQHEDAFPKANIDQAIWDIWSVETFCRTKESIAPEGIP